MGGGLLVKSQAVFSSMTYITGLSQTPLLVAPGTMTAVDPDWTAPVILAQGVQTGMPLVNSAEVNVIHVGDFKLRIHMVQVPFEWFALKFLPKLQPFLDAGKKSRGERN